MQIYIASGPIVLFGIYAVSFCFITALKWIAGTEMPEHIIDAANGGNLIGIGLILLALAIPLVVAMLQYGPKKTEEKTPTAAPQPFSNGVRCPDHTGLIRETAANGMMLGAISNRLDKMEEKQDETTRMVIEIHAVTGQMAKLNSTS
jgi:hypothetical protein